MPLLKPTRGLQLNRNHPLARSLIGCWPFNEGTGSNVRNLIDPTGATDGTFEGDPVWIPGQYGSAISFDGSGDGVGLSQNDGLEPSVITVATVINLNANQSDEVLLQHWALDSSKGFCIGVGSTQNTLKYHTNVWQNPCGSSPLTPGKPYSVIATFDGDLETLYVDGVLVDTRCGQSLSYSNRGWKFGRWEYYGQEFNGVIEFVLMWDKVLSAPEIALIYREPFCMFDRAIRLELMCPAIAEVSLVGSISAQSATSVALKLSRKVAGTITSNSNVTALLKSVSGSPEIKRDWLKDALFNGMTANAFKLGTTLSSGWFWARVAGCSVLYRGLSMEQIDFTNILTVVDRDACVISPPDYLTHKSSSTYFYVIRRFNNCGYQEQTLAAAVELSIDAVGELEKPRPNKVFSLRAEQVSDNKVRLVWFYCPLEQKSKPACFNVYYDGRAGQIDYENPLATISYQGQKFYSYQSDDLEAGEYLFAVIAEDAYGEKNNSLANLRIQLASANPEPIDILSVENL